MSSGALLSLIFKTHTHTLLYSSYYVPSSILLLKKNYHYGQFPYFIRGNSKAKRGDRKTGGRTKIWPSQAGHDPQPE